MQWNKKAASYLKAGLKTEKASISYMPLQKTLFYQFILLLFSTVKEGLSLCFKYAINALRKYFITWTDRTEKTYLLKRNLNVLTQLIYASQI